MTRKRENSTPQKREVDLYWVQKYLCDGTYVAGLNFSEKRMVRKRAERFCYLNGDIFYVGTPTDQTLGKKPRKVLLTHEERWDVVEKCHLDSDGVHYGAEKTAEGIMAKYHWNGIYKFIKDYIRQCSVCVQRHPGMLAPSGQTSTSTGAGDAGDSDGIVQEDTCIYVVQDGEDPASSMPADTAALVDLRLFGPYEFASSERFVLMGVAGQLNWMEVFVLDAISTDSISHCLLQMICRYGEIETVVMSEVSNDLLPILYSAIKQLKEDSNRDITLKKAFMEESASLLKDSQNLIEQFIKKNPTNWPEKIDFALLPLRLARQKSGGTPVKAVEQEEEELDENSAAEALMSVHHGAFTTPTQSPTKTRLTSNKGIVTRSRTGVAKPKTLDHDSYVTPGSKRRWSGDVETGPVVKRVMVEPVNTHVTVKVDGESTSDGESDVNNTDTSSKKSVDLDTYYEAIKQYVDVQTYPDQSSRNFKRLIRDQAKNYIVKEGELYHEVGVKGHLKKIIMGKEERIKLMTEAHLKTSSKQQVLGHLDSVHWKGKQIDCEAFLLASPLADKHDQKSKDIKSTPDAKKQLEYDREDNYTEISNYLLYDVFSSDDATERLDYLKRQLKNFRVEVGELVHVAGNKKRKILLTATDRQKAIEQAHLRKGTHCDITTTYYALGDYYFWYGMKTDVKVYINYCCATQNKHLLDRYFLFREHHLKHPLFTELPGVVAGDDTEAEAHCNLDDTNSKEGIAPVFVTTSTGGGGDADVIQVPVTMAMVQVVTETGDATSIETGEATVEVNTTAVEVGAPIAVSEGSNTPTRIVVKLGSDGSTVIVNEDGTETAANTVLHGATATTPGANPGSDDVTMAAVKSILHDAGALRGNEYVIETSTVQTAATTPVPNTVQHIVQTVQDGMVTKDSIVSKYEVGPMPDQDQIVSEPGEIIAGSSGIADQMPGQVDEACGDSSDDWLHDTDDEGAEGIYDDDQKQQQSLLEQHMVGMDGPYKRVVVPRQHFKCSQCNKIFFGPIKFKMHMYKHTGQKPFPCNQCHKKYTNKKSLVIHQRSHSGELPYLCSLCGRRCPSKIALKSHLKCHDGEGGGFPAKCNICERIFTRKHLMERHKLHKHTNHQTEFKCTECNKVFGHQRSLRRHFMSAHLNVKNHVCGLCGKSFYRKEYLTGHLIQHGGAVAEGLSSRKSRSSFKPRPSVFNHESLIMKRKQDSDDDDIEGAVEDGDATVQRIILHQDENGQLRMVDMATEREVKRMLDARGLSQGNAGETMVVHIEEPSGEPQVVHVEHTEEQVVEVPIEETENYVEYQTIDDDSRQPEFVISAPSTTDASNGQYMYTTGGSEISINSNQELVYGQPAVQYEVECVEVEDDEALSAINLLAQASAQQCENVISQI